MVAERGTLSGSSGLTPPLSLGHRADRGRRQRLLIALATATVWLAGGGLSPATAQTDESVAVQRRVSVSFAAQGSQSTSARVAVAFGQDGGVTVSNRASVAFATSGGTTLTRRVSVSFAVSGGQTVSRGLSVTFQNADELAASNTGVAVSFHATAPLFTDDPLVAKATVIKLIHISELRGQIDTMRARSGLPPYAWSDASPSARSTLVKAVHIQELRTALNSVYLAAGWTLPTYSPSAIAAGQTVVTAAHLAEIRDAVARIW